jgi:hypothetical protein
MRINLAAARYLEALENGDDAALESLWREAAADDNLLEAFREIHEGLIEEAIERESTQVQSAVADAVAKHMPSAEIVRPVGGPVTVADVASELFRSPASGLPAEAHQMIERLLSNTEPLPEKLGLPALIAWAEPRFGPAPEQLWDAFRQAAIKLKARANDAEYQLAARRTKPRPEASP